MKERGKLAYMKGILRSYPEIRAKPPKERTRNEQRRLEIVESVLDAVDHMPDAQSKRKIIEMVYFKKSHTLHGAAMEIPVGSRTVDRWNARIMSAVKEIMDLP